MSNCWSFINSGKSYDKIHLTPDDIGVPTNFQHIQHMDVKTHIEDQAPKSRSSSLRSDHSNDLLLQELRTKLKIPIAGPTQPSQPPVSLLDMTVPLQDVDNYIINVGNCNTVPRKPPRGTGRVNTRPKKSHKSSVGLDKDDIGMPTDFQHIQRWTFSYGLNIPEPVYEEITECRPVSVMAPKVDDPL
ncbi:unnamed protein product, partial [Oppiella nova]